MLRTIGKWVVYSFRDGGIVRLSKPFATKKLAEKERVKLMRADHKKSALGVGIVR